MTCSAPSATPRITTSAIVTGLPPFLLRLALLLLFPGPQLLHLARHAQSSLLLHALGFLVLLAVFLLAPVKGVEIGEQRIGKLVVAGGRLRPRWWRRRFRSGLGLLLFALLGAAGTFIGLQARAAHFFPRAALGRFARLARFLDLLEQRLRLAPRQ